MVAPVATELQPHVVTWGCEERYDRHACSVAHRHPPDQHARSGAPAAMLLRARAVVASASFRTARFARTQSRTHCSACHDSSTMDAATIDRVRGALWGTLSTLAQRCSPEPDRPSLAQLVLLSFRQLVTLHLRATLDGRGETMLPLTSVSGEFVHTQHHTTAWKPGIGSMHDERDGRTRGKKGRHDELPL